MSLRKRRFNNPTEPAKQIWAALFPNEPWPKGWRVEWAGFMRGALGLTIYSERRVLLSYGDHAGAPAYLPRNLARLGFHGPGEFIRRPSVIHTLVHEFVHMRSHGLRHGREFTQLENGMLWRLGLLRSEATAPQC